MTTATFQILLALAGGERHGYAIMQEVEQHSGGKVRLGPGTLYGAMQRLLEEGWIEETTGPPGGDVERRRYYRLTRDGKKAAAAEAARMRDLVERAEAKRLLRHAE